MVEEITYLVSYACPTCRTALQGRADRPDPWLRCPQCGRASQPPRAEQAVQRLSRQAAPPTPEEAADMLVIPDAPPLKPMTPVATAVPPSAWPGAGAAARSSARGVARAGPHALDREPSPAPLPDALARRAEGSTARDLRVLFASGLFVSTTFTLFTYLEQNVTGVSICSLLVLIFLIFLILSNRSPRVDV